MRGHQTAHVRATCGPRAAPLCGMNMNFLMVYISIRQKVEQTPNLTMICWRNISEKAILLSSILWGGEKENEPGYSEEIS